MQKKKPKNAIPNANSPELLIRLVEAVARGIRTPRGLQENLGIELISVQGYVQAGEWLGFLESHGDIWLTPMGLEFAFAGKKQGLVYARAVWNNAFVREVMKGQGAELPTTTRLAQHIAIVHPDTPEDERLTQAKALRNLIAPGLQRAQPKVIPKPDQLELPLGFIPPDVPNIDFSGIGESEFDPDIYRYFLSHLLDYGEMNLVHVRGLLDVALADTVAIGGILAMAKTRGDAHQVEDRLIATQGAVARKEVVLSVESIILSDPDYRQYLQSLLDPKELTSQPFALRPQDSLRYHLWHKRLFGGHTKPKMIRHRLEQILLDRSLESFPVAGSTGFTPTLSERPFLDVWEKDGLLLCCPPSLKLLRGGLDVTNRLFRRAQKGTSSVGIPDLTDRPLYFHGGLLHPNEPPPRNVPDTLSLRIRVLMNSPYLAMICALLLGQRMDPKGPSLRLISGRWCIQNGSKSMGNILPMLDAFAHAQGWIPCRREPSPLGAEDLLSILETLGIASRITSGMVLAERFFAHLRTDVEEMEVHRRLRPLAEKQLAWLRSAQPIQGMRTHFGD